MLTFFQNTVPISVWYMLLSALGFALMAACVKGVSSQGIPVLEIVVVRALVSAVLSYADIKRQKLSLWGNNKPWLFARGLVGALTLMLVYYALTVLPLAEATILQYLPPVFTAILAFYFLKEAIYRSTIICIVLSLLGLCIMILPNVIQVDTLEASTGQYHWLAISAAIGGALGSAIAYIIVKKLTATDHSSVIIFYFPLISLPIALLLLGRDFVVPSLGVAGALVLIGIFTQVGQIGLTKALHSADANKATAYAYVQVIFAAFIGWAYFGEMPTLTTFIGGGLIIFGALVNVLSRR
ncbi:Predicted permeases [Alteromonadaceae bacterium Bs31]|nr:Predicted permeases [Alteromonadaceae bacterium Bs31]